MPSFDLGSGFSKGDVLDVQEITGDHLDTTAQSIGDVTVRDDGTVDVVAQRVGRFLLIGKSKTVGVIVRSDGRHEGPINVQKSGRWSRDSEATFERLDAPLNTEQSEAQTGPKDDLGDVEVEETPPLPETQTVTEKELKDAISAKRDGPSTEGMTPVAAAETKHAAVAEEKARRAEARRSNRNAKRTPRKPSEK